MTDNPLLFDRRIDSLKSKIEESMRSSVAAAERFIEPAQGTVTSAKSRRNHFIFGRRGSGKSSLLHKIESDGKLAKAPIASIDMELFKNHSYPDVSISVLLKTMQCFLDCTNEKFDGTKWYERKKKQSEKQIRALSSELAVQIGELEVLLNSEEGSRRTATKSSSGKNSVKVSAEFSKVGQTGKIGAASETSNAQELVDEFTVEKLNYLLRAHVKYNSLFRKISEVFGKDGFILVDDLYHIKKEDQVEIVDLFHRIAKGTGIWLKVGTIKHRTTYYVAGAPPKGMKIGDDAASIDLDVTLENYGTTKSFLLKILTQFCAEVGLDLDAIFTAGARDRLVLSSGGVARDALTLFNYAISIARERLISGSKKDKSSMRIGVEDINKAAGKNNSNKREEFITDSGASELRERLERQLDAIKKFCLSDINKNCFLVEQDLRSDEFEEIETLVDLKFLHKANSRVTVRDETGKVYLAYMLDISEYAGDRAKRGLNIIKFWSKDDRDQLRNKSLIYLRKRGGITELR